MPHRSTNQNNRSEAALGIVTVPGVVHSGRLTRSRRAGFTLSEVVMVLAIITVAAGIAVPRYDGAVSRYRCELAARRLASDLQLARAQARATSTAIDVDFSANAYALDTIVALDKPGATYQVDLSQPPYQVSVQNNLGNPQRVTFNAYGVPSKGGAFTVRSNRHTRTVALDPTSGVAQVE